MKTYFISGLGADSRAFSRIQLPPGYEPVHLEWIPPKPNEELSDYARRFSSVIKPSEDFILIGLSFGGILATEIAKIISPNKLIIISSLSSYNELPWYFKLAGRIGLHRLISPGFYKRMTILNRIMGPGDTEMKEIVYDYVKKIDPEFIRWSLKAILNWAHMERLPELVHIHGGKDHLLPVRYVKADYVVQKGGHLMVMNKPEEINRLLSMVLV